MKREAVLNLPAALVLGLLSSLSVHAIDLIGLMGPAELPDSPDDPLEAYSNQLALTLALLPVVLVFTVVCGTLAVVYVGRALAWTGFAGHPLPEAKRGRALAAFHGRCFALIIPLSIGLVVAPWVIGALVYALPLKGLTIWLADALVAITDSMAIEGSFLYGFLHSIIAALEEPSAIVASLVMVAGLLCLNLVAILLALDARAPIDTMLELVRTRFWRIAGIALAGQLVLSLAAMAGTPVDDGGHWIWLVAEFALAGLIGLGQILLLLAFVVPHDIPRRGATGEVDNDSGAGSAGWYMDRDV